MVKHNQLNTLLMEILIVVLFFALCSTVILDVFVGAHNQSARAGAQADALTAAQVAQIRDVVLSKSSVTAQNITVVEVK